MNRTDFQQLADIRIDEAAVLLAQQKWDGAYYLAGYAVECALKACIAKMTKQDDFPPYKKFSEDCYSHDLNKLMILAELDDLLDAAMQAEKALAKNWQTIRAWDESSRYKRIPQAKAEEMYNAIVDPKHGVLPWLKQYY